MRLFEKCDFLQQTLLRNNPLGLLRPPASSLSIALHRLVELFRTVLPFFCTKIDLFLFVFSPAIQFVRKLRKTLFGWLFISASSGFPLTRAYVAFFGFIKGLWNMPSILQQIICRLEIIVLHLTRSARISNSGSWRKA
jgi:hypothetical protein